jgi:ParB family chromosome partitioning protein
MTKVESLISFLTQVEVDKIAPNRFRLRELDEAIVKELIESIKANGLLQPIIVRPIDNLRYELVFGLHRLEAVKRLGLKFIPAVIVSVSEEEAFLMNVVENLQRNIKINPIMEAQGYKNLIAKGWTIHEIALKIGKSDSYVYERLRLLDKLHPAIQEKLTSRACKTAITPSHAERLTLINDKRQQLELAKLIEEKHLSLHQLERLTRKIQQFSLPKNCLCVKCPNYPCKLFKKFKEI